MWESLGEAPRVLTSPFPPSILIHLLFALSFIAPGAYLAWMDATGRALRTDRGPLWLGLAFAIPTSVLCVLAPPRWQPADTYLVLYGLLLATGILARGGGAMLHSARRDEAPDKDEPEQKPTPRGPPGSRCVPILLADSGTEKKSAKQGKSGLSWLIGSNYYQWALTAEIVHEDDSSVAVKATMHGEYIPWHGIQTRPVDVEELVVGRVVCIEVDGKCQARIIGGEVVPQGRAFDMAIFVGPAPTGIAGDMKVEAKCWVEGALMFDDIEVKTGVEGQLGPVKPSFSIGSKVKRLNEARDRALVSRTYSFDCASRR